MLFSIVCGRTLVKCDISLQLKERLVFPRAKTKHLEFTASSHLKALFSVTPCKLDIGIWNLTVCES